MNPRPLDVGRLLDGALTLGLRRFGTLAALAAVVAVPLQVLVALRLADAITFQSLHPESASAAGGVAGAVFLAAAVWVVALAAETAVAGPAAVGAWVSGTGGNDPQGLGARIPPAVGAAVVEGALVYAAPFALAFAAARRDDAALVLLDVFVAAPLAAVLAPLLVFAPLEAAFGAGPLAAQRRSWAVVRRGYFRVVGALLCVQVLAAVVIALPAVVLYAAGPGGGTGLAIWLLVAGVVTQVAVAPFRVATVAALWVDLRMRREGLDLEMRLMPGREFEALAR